jgi:prepilin-type N-terminal cleavage/methylation domain-containing protein
MLNDTKARLEQRRRDGGFTLIELLIVIVILGILAAIVVFSVANVTDNGSKSACKTTVETADSALEAYYAQNTAAATTFGALVPKYLHPSDIFTSGTGATTTTKDSSGHFYKVVAVAGGAGDVQVASAAAGPFGDVSTC